MNPTPEQVKAVELFKTGASMVVEAGAGTGKTTVLRMMAEACPDRTMQYIAFNKAIVEESKAKMPDNVSCNTAHSLAYRSVGKKYQSRMRRARRMKAFEKARIIGVIDYQCRGLDGLPKTLYSGYLAGLVMRAVTNYCNSAEDEVQRHHVPYVDGIDQPNALGQRTHKQNGALKEYLLPFVKKAWEDLQRADGQLPFQHAHYLKLFQLSKPQLQVDVVLFDEAQDANPVIASIVEMQTKAQRVYVGDSQQQIYEFTGAINAMQRLDGERAYLSKSFRFGPAIARAANTVLSMLDSPLNLTGFDQIDSKLGYLPLGSYDAILCRTNAAAVSAMLSAIRDGRKAHMVGGGREIISFTKAADRLMGGQGSEHPDLACFSSWAEVQDYVKNDAEGDELGLMVRLIDEFGCSTILSAIERQPREDVADLVVSTAHKAKGREWPRLLLAADFKEPKSEEEGGTGKPSDSELRLFYVAVTRARDVLDTTQCPLATALGIVSGKQFIEDHVEVIPVTLPDRPAEDKATFDRVIEEHAPPCFNPKDEAPDDAVLVMQWPDGDELQTTLKAFREANESAWDIEHETVARLDVGESKTLGGGAGVQVKVRRVA